MTVENQFPYQSYTANGLQTSFTLSFYVEDKGNFFVKKDDVVVSVNDYVYDSPTNSITFNTAPPQGCLIEIERVTSTDRSTNYATFNNSFRPEVLNYDIDRIWRKLQEFGVFNWFTENNINNLSEYVNSLNEETKQQFLEELDKAGVSLNQLNAYVNNLYESLATIAVERGWLAEFVADSSGRNQQQINNDLLSKFRVRVSPRQFGSMNNGIDDDAGAIRAAIAYLNSVGGGVLDLQTVIPWQIKSLSSDNTNAIIVGGSNIVFDFGHPYQAYFEAKIEMDSMILLSTEYKNKIEFLGGGLRGGNLANYGIKSKEDVFNPFLFFKSFDARGFKEAAASLNPYMSTFINSQFGFSKKGLVLNNSGITKEITSTTLIGCYANGCSEKGFEISDRIMYSNLMSCGVDDCGGIAYDIAAQSTNILGCGAERCDKFARFTVNDGVTVNGFIGVGIGSLDENSPVDAAFEVSGGGYNAIQFSGVRMLNHPTQPRYRTKDLKVVTSSGKYPKIIVHDRSFLKENTSIEGSTSVYGNIVEFKENYIRNNDSITLLTADLSGLFNRISNTTNEFTYTVQLNNGTENLDKVLSKLNGNGTLIIQGNSTDRTQVRLKGARLGFLIKNCSCRIVLRNLTIENQYNISDNSQTQLDIDNCRFVVLDNVLFDAPDFAVGSAIRARNGSQVVLMNGTTCGTNHTTGAAYEMQTGSTIRIQAVSAPPVGRWTYGMRVTNSDPSVNGIIEWVYVRNISTSTNEWKAFS